MKAEPAGREPGIFGPEDFAIFAEGVAERLAEAWFQGRILLADKSMVEDHDFLVKWDVGLVVSGNAGYIRDRACFWFYEIYA